MKNSKITFGAAIIASSIAPTFAAAPPVKAVADQSKERPNILWIITDDHRGDALACFNKATRGTEESALGYVSSPSLDKLASEGTLFTSTYCNSPASAPSRTSMHTGQYPHHRGVFGFEYYHDGRDYTPLTMPEYMTNAGYNVVGMGKLGVRYKKYIGPKRTGTKSIYPVFFDTGAHCKLGLTDASSISKWAGGSISETLFSYYTDDGTKKSFYTYLRDEPIPAEHHAIRKEYMEKYDILDNYTGAKPRTKNKAPLFILGGVNSKSTEGTTDGVLMREFCGFLDSKGTYNSLSKSSAPSPDPTQPQLFYIGHHFPHTDVLPSASFRAKFEGKRYNIPKFDQEELDKMPDQMKRWRRPSDIDGMSNKEKEQLIRDYYAFCAMGDSLIGVEVDRFKKFCKDAKKEYLILVVCGDHSWHLGEQGVCAKFAAYENSNHTTVIAVSSDKKLIPAGKVVNDYVEHVDFMPTILSAGGYNLNDEGFKHLDGYNLVDVISGKATKREYVIGELNAVCGPHGQIRTRDFLFGMRTRKDNGFYTKNSDVPANKEMRWALDSKLEDVDPILYDLRVDPLERNNVALDPAYKEVAEYMRTKLGNIILGDGRIEGGWDEQNTYKRSTFGIGSDDKKFDMPKEIIPKVKVKSKKKK